MKKYIFFDLDGTITDPMEGITKGVRYALNKFNIEVNQLEDLCKFIGPPLKDSFIEYYNFSEEDSDKAVLYYREYFADKGIYENILYENFEKVLVSLKNQEKTLIVATSKPTVFAERIIEHFNLKTYFDYVCGSNLDGTRTKKGEVIKHALYQSNIENISDVIMIGDRKHDVVGAKEHGMESVGVLYGYGSYEELNDSGADYIVKDLDELTELLVGL